jgi:hypothetical protein
MDTMPATAGTASSNPSWLPRVNRRRPFDLHWRRDPSEWGGRIASAHRYRRHVLGADTPPVMTVDDGAVAYWWCPQCGSIACPLDPSALISTDVDGKKTSLVEGRKPDAAFILQLTTEKAELERQLAEVCISYDATRSSRC